jgi:ribosomal protein S18 acetylase RimI-like enzyme
VPASRTGLAQLLMGLHQTVAANLPPVEKVMLTCFMANERGLRFYRKLGFVVDDTSPGPRRLRGGKIVTPDYCIMSKPVVIQPQEGKPVDEVAQDKKMKQSTS